MGTEREQTIEMHSALEEQRWAQVLSRTASVDFVYGVTTTGVFCRPNCPSRRPARAHARFFDQPAQARAAGFRPCQRCRPQGASADAVLAAQIAAYLRQHSDRQVSLAELGRTVGVSPFTAQRAFARTLGMSPRAYANALRAERFRAALQEPGASVTEAVYIAGFSAPSRAGHAAPLAMAAKRYRARGAGEQIACCVADAPREELGKVLVAGTARGVCAVLLGASEAELVAELQRRFRAAVIVTEKEQKKTEDAAALAAQVQQWTDAVLAQLREPAAARELPLDLRGTAFQARVWAALRAIPCGETRSYRELAASLGNAKAVRAVAQACGANPAAVVVPCHRVVGADGSLTGYRWGVERKRKLLEGEA